MQHETLNSSRFFQMWSYTTSHSELLLRSTKGSGQTTRIDVLFKDVIAIHLPTIFDSLAISESTEEEKSKLHAQIDARKLDGRKTFMVRGGSFPGYVIAAFVASHEDGGEYYDPSYFSPKTN